MYSPLNWTLVLEWLHCQMYSLVCDHIYQHPMLDWAGEYKWGCTLKKLSIFKIHQGKVENKEGTILFLHNVHIYYPPHAYQKSGVGLTRRMHKKDLEKIRVRYLLRCCSTEERPKLCIPGNVLKGYGIYYIEIIRILHMQLLR
ncbi:hypothetical protein GDO78_005988 [Eleutherodactylus coqui]|uniref:Uncharacterized protein n=1 Tax=Eleutherodactylus coqui TaxID=57060 RepID=A0A8J6FMA1_ELECQ|nr:hypothetical protein GDO78_005988 [Eleutherodactylus coqui]